jgi:acyl carrier protein phosphodiesterase
VNHLAHFHLAWPEKALLAGAIEGDYRKGPLDGEQADAVTRGVQLHRVIDAYTDQHPDLAALRREFSPGLRRYAGILLDLCFDHYLSLHWRAFADLELQAFNEQVLTVLENEPQLLGASSRRAVQRFRQYRVLTRYGDWDMVTASAARVGERLRHANPLHDVDEELVGLRPGIEQAFLDFYPQLDRHVREWRSTTGDRIVAADD